MNQPEQKATCQNRLLILTASLLFYYYSDAKIESYSLLGTAIRFGNADAFVEFMWLIWAYYYLRTFHYYKEFGHSSYSDALRSAFINEIEVLMSSAEKDELRILQDKENDQLLDSKITIKYPLRIKASQPKLLNFIIKSWRIFISKVIHLPLAKEAYKQHQPFRINLLERGINESIGSDSIDLRFKPPCA